MDRILAAKVSVAKGFVSDFHPGKKEAGGKSGVLRIAGNKEHLQAWAERTGLFRELTAVQTWQADIGDEQVDPMLGAERYRNPDGPSAASTAW